MKAKKRVGKKRRSSSVESAPVNSSGSTGSGFNRFVESPKPTYDVLKSRSVSKNKSPEAAFNKEAWKPNDI